MIFNYKNKKRIFLDHASITPVAGEVAKTMAEFSKNNFANPSALYEEGMTAKKAMKESREKIAKTIGGRAGEIIFTSGGTESDNLALLGVFEQAKRNGIENPHIITTKIEHPAVLEVCHEIERRGGEVSYISVSEEGIVSPKDIGEKIKENTVLISVMFANNEIGTIQPVKEIGKMIKEYRAKNFATKYENIGTKAPQGVLNGKAMSALGRPLFHTDACQAFLYEKIDVSKLGVDMLTLDGIKMYGPRGIGLLYVRDGVEIQRMIFGGGHERGLRSGTENVAGIVGLAKAFEIAENLREKESVRLSEIRDYGMKKILAEFPKAEVNGSLTERLPNNINICFPGVDSEYVVVALDVEGVAVSYSSTCKTLAEDSSSYVVSALGKPQCATSSLRVTLGRETKKKDIDVLVKALKKIVM